MSNEYIVKTQRIVGKCRITVRLTFEVPVTIKFDLPDRPRAVSATKRSPCD